MSILREVKNVARFESILSTLFNHEFGFLIDKLELKKHLPFHKRWQKDKFKHIPTKPERVRIVLEELGASFVKLGQLLSLRPDLIPKEYCDEFRKLQDEVKPFPGKIARKIIEQELRAPIKDIFSEFDEIPVASASIAQVHRAKLKTGEEVAIKVQRPGIKEVFITDVDIMYRIAALFEKKIPSDIIDPVDIVKEFERYTKDELDFVHEAKNISRFHRNFEKSRKIKIPRVFFEYTTSKVLTMEFIHGKKLFELKSISKKKKEAILKKTIDALFQQIFEDGYFHADPHAGNIIVMKDGRIVLIDFGIVGYLDDDLRKKIYDLTSSILSKDLHGITESMAELGFVEDGHDLSSLEHDLRHGLSEYYGTTLKQINFSEVMHKIIDIARQHDIRFPSNFILLVKSLITIEGVAADLDSIFNVVDYLKPRIKKLVRNKYLGSKNISDQVKRSSIDYLDFFKAFPRSARNIMQRISEGRIKVDIEDTDISRLTMELDRSSNRLAYGLIISALLVSCAIVIYTNIGPAVYGIPIIALIGLAVAAFLGMILVVSISQEGKR